MYYVSPGYFFLQIFYIATVPSPNNITVHSFKLIIFILQQDSSSFFSPFDCQIVEVVSLFATMDPLKIGKQVLNKDDI